MHHLSIYLWHDKSFDRLRNLPAILKCVVFVTTSPALPNVLARVDTRKPRTTGNIELISITHMPPMLRGDYSWFNEQDMASLSTQSTKLVTLDGNLVKTCY